jgi:hypothetical protein
MALMGFVEVNAVFLLGLWKMGFWKWSEITLI